MSKSILTEILGPEKESESSPGALESCIHELIEAVHSRNVQAAKEAFKACFTECEMQPHDEYDSEE